MGVNNVYNKFKKIYPEKSITVEKIFSNGNNSLRIIMYDQTEWIFTYKSDAIHILETIKSYKKRLNERNKKGG